MSEAIQLNDYIDQTRGDSYPSRALARKSGGSGGDMEDVLKRVGAVESSVSELRVQVGGIAATMATKDALNELQVQVGGIAAKIPYLATNEGLNEVRAIIPHLATKADALTLRADLYAMETKIIKWMIATALTSVGLATGLAFSIARFVH